MSEEWRDIPGFEGRYQVSDLGSVKSVDWLIEYELKDGTKKKRVQYGRTMKTPSNGQGYLHCGLFKPEGGAVFITVHILVAISFLGPVPEGQEVLHGDGDQKNNKLTNLRYGTRRDNMQDMILHGRGRNGEKHPMAKLTADIVVEIRKRVGGGETQRAVAAALGIGYKHVNEVVKRRTWNHVA